MSANRPYWETAAQEDALFHVATSRRDWTLRDFLHDGEIRSQKWVLPWLFEEGLDIGETTLLEIGCGVGRFGHSLAPRLHHYVGIDITAGMLARADEIMGAIKNKSLILGDGSSLAPIETASIDAVYSYAVLQHIYERDVVLNYLREAVRVLRPGGVAKIQMLGRNASSGLRLRFVRVDDLRVTSATRALMGKLGTRMHLRSADNLSGRSPVRDFAKAKLRTRLPDDFLIPTFRRYRGGAGMRGEGIDYRESVAAIRATGCEVHTAPFEATPLSEKYWLLLRKPA